MMNIETWHAGHQYINGIHWIAHCPTCTTLVAEAERAAAAAIDDDNKGEQQ